MFNKNNYRSDSFIQPTLNVLDSCAQIKPIGIDFPFNHPLERNRISISTRSSIAVTRVDFATLISVNAHNNELLRHLQADTDMSARPLQRNWDPTRYVPAIERWSAAQIQQVAKAIVSSQLEFRKVNNTANGLNRKDPSA